MRIRAIEVRNWACIESLSLTDLRDGIVVLHGPNQTGKSSLAEAVRGCLFDLDHNSTSQKLAMAIPRQTRRTPEITIEFEIGPNRFRVAKAFSKNKDGYARVEQLGAAGWTAVEEGKEANRKIRDILGVEKSTSGLFQLLWLQQGEIRLPDKADPVLTEALESILRSMITGRDIDFKKRLDKACERWFTVKTMQDKKGSPVAKLTADLEDARAAKAEVDRKWADAESALRQYEEAIERQPELQRLLEDAERELTQIGKERESITLRKSQYDLAVKHRDAEERQYNQALQQLQQWDAAQNQLVQFEKNLHDANFQMLTASEKITHAQVEVDQTRKDVAAAEQALTQHQQTRAALDDRALLVNLATQCHALDRSLQQIDEWTQSIRELESNLTGPAALDQTQIDRLRANRAEAIKLRAQLEAAEMQLVVQARRPIEGEINLDGQAGTTVSLEKDGEQLWLIRQHAEFTLGDLATIRIGRVQEDRNLEQAAQRLADLERDYRQTVSASQIDPDSPTALDALVTRRLEHEAWSKDLQRLRSEISRSAPAGLPALQVRRKQWSDQQEAVFARREELREWTPNQGQLDQWRGDFERQQTDHQSRLENARGADTRASQILVHEQTSHQKIKDQIAGLQVEIRTTKEKLGQHNHAAFADAVDQAKVRLAEAEAKLQESTLTPTEQGIEARYQAATSARTQRGLRARDNEDALLRLQTQLMGTEGLHQKRIQAEQAVNDKTLALERERLYADAHKHLKELFEQVRQEQVRRTVGPINDRVMQWAHQLGLTDYSGLDFQEQLLPGGLMPRHAVDGEPIEMDRESYGTLEQLSLLIRLAVGGLLARNEPAVAILDDPLAHADPLKHRKMLDILARAARGEPNGEHPTGPMQLIILTCHADRFDYLDGAQQIDLARLIQRGG